MTHILLQIPTPPPGSIENVTVALAAIASIVLLGKKLFVRPPAEFVQRADLREVAVKVDALRDTMDMRIAQLSDRVERLGESIHGKLNELEAGVARVDERTRKS